MIAFLPILPLLSIFTFPAPDIETRVAPPRSDARIEVVSAPRVAQVRLAETLAEADAIESVSANVSAKGRVITFAIVHAGESLDVIAKTSKTGEVIALAITPARPLAARLHGLTWLGSELADATAVTRLVVDDDGGVMIGTNDGRRYMAIPGRGSGGANVAAEARWAAAWSNDDS